MPVQKIVEKTQASYVRDDATFLIEQIERNNGQDVHSLRRAPLSKVVDALKANMPNFAQDIVPVEGGINVTFWSGETLMIPVDAGGVGFAGWQVDEDGYLHLVDDEGEDVIDPVYIGNAGGGGGSSETTRPEVTNLTPSLSMTVAKGASCPISFSYFDYDTQGDLTVSSGALTVTVGTKTVIQRTIEQGSHTIDLKDYLSEGVNKVKVKVTDEDDHYASKSWTVTVVALSVSSSFDDTIVYTGDVIFRYTPVGDGIDKTIHFELDGQTIAAPVISASNRQQTQMIQAQSHGAHRLVVYATATAAGVSVSSNILTYDIIWSEIGVETPIVASSFAGSAVQYSTVAIPYIVYSPMSLTSDITLAINGNVLSTLTVDRTEQIWNYKPQNVGTDVLTITCGEVTKTINLVVASSGVDVQPVTTGLVMDLNPQGHTNQDTNKTSFGYTDGEGVNHPLTFSSNFDWQNGGFQTDENGDRAFLVKCGTRVTFDRSLFLGADNVTQNGKEIKLVFKAANCRDYDAVVASCMSGGIGMTVNAQRALVSSEQTSLEVQYCEDNRIEMDINIEPVSDDRIMMAWLEGIPSKVSIYEENDNFGQYSATPLVIGSDDCDVWVYRLKMYETHLSRYEIHENWIADAPDAEEMLARYTRNDIYDQSGKIDIDKLSAANPTLRVIEIEAARMTTGKKDPVSCTIRHRFPAGGNAHTWTATRAVFKVQGTSSSKYGEAGYNFDIDMSDAESWVDGLGNEIEGYSMTDQSIPVDYFNIKVNVASSENANNVILADDYNEFQPYINPARRADPRVRDTVEGHPCVVFFKNTSSEPIQVGPRIYQPGEVRMYGCGDMNNSKKNLEVFGQTDVSRQMCVEIDNNTNNQCRFKSADLSGETWDGEGSFEFRFPDTKNPTDAQKAAWQRVLSWTVSTDRTAATGNTLLNPVTYAGVTYTSDTAEYRAAKFKAEFENYWIKDSVLYHYLFTERHTMVDNRSKNTFCSTEDGIHWDYTKDYDNDTADGNDNEGGLTLSYGLEDTDTIGTKDVFNAADNVLFCNVRDLFADDLREMFVSLENKGAWDAQRILAKFKAHQAARPEALVVEDMYKKYIEPFTEPNGTHTDAYLEMLLGTKEDQRRQFEKYQEMYMSTKYRGKVATEEAMTFRTYTPTEWDGVEPSRNITITPYADMYVVLQAGSGVVSQRAKRGQSYTLEAPIDVLNDTETYIYGARMIADVGDLAPLYVGFFNIAAAVKLRNLKLGSGVEGYSNTNVQTLTVGNNPLLETIDIRNCPNIKQGLNLTGCAALTELEAEGSGLTGVAFAPGGNLVTAHLPAIASFSAIQLNALEDLTFSAYTSLRSARIENMDTIDILAFIRAAGVKSSEDDVTGLERVRFLGIDWELSNAETVEGVLSDAEILDALVNLKGLDENGLPIEQSVLSGSVYIPILRQAQYNSYLRAWTDIEVRYDTMIPTYTVTYCNWDGTVLGTAEVDRNDTAPDPVAAGICGTPTRPMTTSTIYTFSGWDGVFTNVTSNRTLTAEYSESTRTYTVRWISRLGVVLETQTVEYGEDAEFSGGIPVRTDGESLATYYLFAGWDKSTGFVDQDIDVWAIWETGSVPEAGTQLCDMSAAQVYAICKANSQSDFFYLKDRIEIPFGFDPQFTNVEKTVVTENEYFDGNTCRDTGIQLFADGIGDGWTIVIDCKFDSGASTDDTLICAMQEDGYMGFKLKYASGPAVQWSSMSFASSAGAERELMVIRHPRGDQNVQVYTSHCYEDQIETRWLTKTIDTQSAVHLFLGATVTDGGAFTNYGKGWIYNLTIWHDDLGNKVCRQLAGWTRESYTFEIANDFQSANFEHCAYASADDASEYAGIDFICADQLLRGHKINATNTNAGGYGESLLAPWIESRVYAAFPVQWRQIMMECGVKYATHEGEVESIPAHVWIPSYIEVQGGTSEPWVYEGTYVPFFINSYARLKFKGMHMRNGPYNALTNPEGYQVIVDGVDPVASGYESAVPIRDGDIWIDTSNSSIGKLRVGDTWVSASSWWLRGASQSNPAAFCYVGTYGGANTSGSTATTVIGVVPRFSICKAM